MTEQDLLMQELRMENEELHRTVYDLRRENDELRKKYENEQLCYVSEMCDHERLKQTQRISVSEIGLPERTWHALRRYGIHDVDMLRKYAADCKLTVIPGVGEAGAKLIKKALKELERINNGRNQESC